MSRKDLAMFPTFRFAMFLSAIASATVVQAGSPRLARVTPPGGQRGTTVEVHLIGRYLDSPQEVVFYEPGIAVEAIEPLEGEIETAGRRERVEPGTRVRVRLKLADDCPLGPHGLRLRTASGVTDYQRFFVGPFPAVDEDELPQRRNDRRETAKEVPMNSTIVGRMIEPADVDLYKVEARRGDRITAEIEAARIGVERGLPDLHLAILDADGKPLLQADDSSLFLQDPIASILADRDGSYFVQVRHSTYAAANETYRLHVGNFPRPTGVYPAGGQAGSELDVQILGDPRGQWTASVRLPTESGDFAFVAIDSDTGASAPSPNTMRVSPFPNVLEAEPNDSPDAMTDAPIAELPTAFNGVIERPGDVDCFRFQAKKGERFKVHCLANALGSPLDPTIWIQRVGERAGAPVRATDSRPNQLGFPPVGGLNRDTLDPVIEFTIVADGEFLLGVEDDRGRGGAEFVYRVECQHDADAVYTYISPEPEDRFTPQVRQSIAVPAGNRYNTQIAVFNTNRPAGGDLELVAVGLPEGVTMTAPRIAPGMTRVPVVFEAAADAKPQAGFINLLVKPVGDDEKTIASGYRQAIAMNQYGNNDFYLHTVVDKLLVAVTEPAPFTIEVEEPKSALVQNGETALRFFVRRAPDFDGPVTVSLEWRPNGVNTATPVTVPPDKTEGEYLIGAARNATAGSYQVTLTATNGPARANYNDPANRTYVAAKPFKLAVAEPHIEGRFVRTSIERGKTADLVCRLNHLKPFAGKAKVTLARLPRGVVMVEPTREITVEDKEVVFTLRATEDCLLGNYQGVALDVTVVEDGHATRQLSGFGMLRIDPERGARASVK
jgi:hypothetical protein